MKPRDDKNQVIVAKLPEWRAARRRWEALNGMTLAELWEGIKAHPDNPPEIALTEWFIETDEGD